MSIFSTGESLAPAPVRMSAPALLTQTSRRPSAVAGGRAKRLERLRVGQVEAQDGGATAERLDFALHVARSLLVDPIGHRDVGAGAGGSECDGAADAARCSGDEHGAAGQRCSDRVDRHERVLYDPLQQVFNWTAECDYS